MYKAWLVWYICTRPVQGLASVVHMYKAWLVLYIAKTHQWIRMMRWEWQMKAVCSEVVSILHVQVHHRYRYVHLCMCTYLYRPVYTTTQPNGHTFSGVGTLRGLGLVRLNGLVSGERSHNATHMGRKATLCHTDGTYAAIVCTHLRHAMRTKHNFYHIHSTKCSNSLLIGSVHAHVCS